MSMTKPITAAIISLLYPEMLMSQSKEEALRTLRLLSDQDFGDDVKAWVKWAKANGHWEYDGPDVLDQTESR
jgi:hypothetical protein